MAPATKMRPYRVDYFDVPEMQGDKALVRSVLVRCPTAKQARDFVAADGRFIIKSYRFYKRLSSQPKKKVYLPIEKLFPGAKAVDVMEQVEAYRAKIAAVPTPVVDVTPTVTRTIVISNEDEPESGPDSPATKAVVEDLNGMMAHDAHEQTFDTFVPDVQPDHATPDPSYGVQQATFYKSNSGTQINDLGNTPAAQADMDAIAKQHDEAMELMKDDMGYKQPCPTCGIGIDNDGDGNCAVCTSPAYHADRTLSMMDYGKPCDYNPPPMPACEEVDLNKALGWIGFTIAVLAAVAAYLYFGHH